MTKTIILSIVTAVCFISVSLFFLSGVGATTENECVIGGGQVSSAKGCSFCVGGKYDLTEITSTGKAVKKDTTQSASDQKTNAANSGQTGNGTVAKSPAGN